VRGQACAHSAKANVAITNPLKSGAGKEGLHQPTRLPAEIALLDIDEFDVEGQRTQPSKRRAINRKVLEAIKNRGLNGPQ
jgi:hypothetical protein